MKKLVLAAIAAAVTFSAYGAARLTFEIKGEPVAIGWDPAKFPISFKVDSTAATTLPGGPEAIARSFQSWQSVDGSQVSFVNAGTVANSSGMDGVNAVGVNDQLFANSGFLAFTTTWFDDNGMIQEADIQVDPSVAGHQGRLEALIEHEVGHLLGLDHSAVVSSTMYPFLSSDALTHLDSDDRNALAQLYPSAGKSAAARLRGAVNGNSGPAFGAQVVALNSIGEPVASALTARDGSFEIEVPAGNYKLYAEPLDGPVDPRNLSGVWRDASSSAVRTEFFRMDQWLQVENGQTHDDLTINATGTATLNPKWIGTFAAGSRDVKLSSNLATLRPGETVSIAIGGEGFVSGMTEFEVLREGVSRVSSFQYGPNYVWATFRVAPETVAGSLVIIARNGNETAALTGALRIDSAPVGEAKPPQGRRRPASGK